MFDGSDSALVIGDGSMLQGGRIRLGSGCSVECGRGCRLASIEIHAAGGGHVRIGDGTGFTSHCRIYLHEPGEIVFGRSCLVAGGTTLSVSDMHSIVDVATGRRLNPPRDIRLGDRVWLGEGVRVWKGASIGAGSIIGTESLVTKPIPENVIAAGVPARVIRTGVTWRHDLLPLDDGATGGSWRRTDMDVSSVGTKLAAAHLPLGESRPQAAAGRLRSVAFTGSGTGAILAALVGIPFPQAIFPVGRRAPATSATGGVPCACPTTRRQRVS
ncbi:MAG: acyltransferase [Planctomycetia bacterium]|nr:acyltransferase [Planctomycetia bacterium]